MELKHFQPPLEIPHYNVHSSHDFFFLIFCTTPPPPPHIFISFEGHPPIPVLFNWIALSRLTLSSYECQCLMVIQKLVTFTSV